MNSDKKNGNNKASKNTNKYPKKNIFLRLINVGILMALWGFLILGAFLGYLYLTLPSPYELAEKTERRPAIRILSSTGTYISSSGDGYGSPIRIKTLKKYIPMAFVATEDRRFFEHRGVDFIGLIRAVYTNVIAGRVKQGGSTISQQVAKNLFLSNTRSFERKIKELVYTIWLETGFEKEEILALYLNRVYMSNGQYGLSAAANHYFGVPADKLTIWQSAVLAGMLKAPNSYNPVFHPKKSAKRARVVLSKMVKAGVITQDQADSVKRNSVKTVFSKINIYCFFKDYVHNEVLNILDAVNQDILVYTTLDVEYQKGAVKAVKKYQKDFQKRGAGQVAVLGMDNTGAIRAMVGGVNFKNSQFNRATQAKRQTGSLFKAFVYAKAMEKYNPESRIKDEPYTVEGYSPRNYNRKYYGVVSLEKAFANSLNIPAVKLGQILGRNNVIEFAYKLGVRSKIQNVRTMALGVSTASLIEMVGAFGAFSSGGKKAQPYSIEKITDNAGRILYQREWDNPQIIAYDVIQKFNEMARASVASGSGKRAYIKGVDIGGKTGTTQSYRDAWFIGYTNKHIAGVWLGNDNSTPTKKITGGSFPALIFKSYMRAVEDKNPSGSLP